MRRTSVLRLPLNRVNPTTHVHLPPALLNHPDSSKGFAHAFQIGVTFNKESTDYIRFQRWRFSYTSRLPNAPAEPLFDSLVLTKTLNTKKFGAATTALTELAKSYSGFEVDVSEPYMVEHEYLSKAPSKPKLAGSNDESSDGTAKQNDTRQKLVGLTLHSNELLELRSRILQMLGLVGQLVSKKIWKAGVVVANGNSAEKALKEMEEDYSYSRRQFVATGLHVRWTRELMAKYEFEHPGWFLPFGGKWKIETRTLTEEDDEEGRRERFTGRKG